MDKDEMREILNRYGVSAVHFARLIDLNKNTVAAYFNNTRQCNSKTVKRIENGVRVLQKYNRMAPEWNRHIRPSSGSWYNIVRGRYLDEIAEYDSGFREVYKAYYETN